MREDERVDEPKTGKQWNEMTPEEIQRAVDEIDQETFLRAETEARRKSLKKSWW